MAEPTALPRYLRSFDPYFQDNLGLGVGKIRLTSELSEALVFEKAADAIRFWQQVSPTVPVRPDGKPNRPLTAFSAILEPL